MYQHDDRDDSNEQSRQGEPIKPKAIGRKHNLQNAKENTG
jgi:hypothetical protein